MPFDPRRALELARRLALPRRLDTPGLADTQALIVTHLEQAGWRVRRQPFEFTSAAETGAGLLCLVALGLSALVAAAWTGPVWVSPAAALILALVLGALGPAYTRLGDAALLDPPGPASAWTWLARRLGRRWQAENIWAERPAVQLPAIPRLVLMAHYDSKSQWLPLPARMGLIVLAGLAGSATALLGLLRPGLPQMGPLAMWTAAATCLGGLPLVFQFLAVPGNASPGAVDNAAGAGLLLHLAEVLADGPRPVSLVLTSAEELGTMGARAWQRARPDADAVWVLNVDGIGPTGRLGLVADRAGRPLARRVLAAAAEQRAPLVRLPLAGARYDHVPLAAAGVVAVSLVGVSRAAWWVHTRHDTPDHLSEAGFRQAGSVVLAVVQGWRATDRGPASPTWSDPAAGG